MTRFSLIQKLRNKIRIDSNNIIVIGSNVRIRYCNIRISGKNNQLIIEDGVNLKGVTLELDGIDCTLSIGKDCVIGENCFISCREKNTSLTIGSNGMLSRNIKIMTSDGHNITRDKIRINSAKNIHIGNDVWLADNVTILKGVTIGNGAVIGINSTVTKHIDENTIAAGNPAKVISHNIKWHNELTY